MSTSRLKHKDTIEGNEPLKFDNMFGELEFYKKRCEVLEKDLIKSQNTIKKMDVSLKKLQEINTINAKVIILIKQSLNNTSIPFFLTSEFKNNWENFAKDQIMEAFENTFDNHFWLAHIVQDTLLIIYQETNFVIFQKINSILKILNIDEKHPEKFLSRFRTFFQEYFMSIFIFSEDILIKIKSKICEIIMKYRSFDETILEGIKKDIESKSFKNLSQIVFKLCIYMLLHEPQLTLNIQPYEKREFSYNFYNKTEHLNIEGFGNDQSSCITILGPPMIRNYLPFHGIKPCVYIIPQPDEEVIKCCQRNKATKKMQQIEKLESSECIVNLNEKTEKTSSPVKSEKKFKDIIQESDIQNNTAYNPLSVIIERQSIPKGNKIASTLIKEQVNPAQISIRDKIPVNFLKLNKFVVKDVEISESNKCLIIDNSNTPVSINEVSSTVNQCYNHPLSLNKKKLATEKYDIEDNNLKNNYRIISQQIKSNSKNSSKSCSLNTSLKTDALKLSEINEAYENMVKISQRQNSSRTTLNTIDQPLYRDSINASNIFLMIDKNVTNATDNISLSRKKNMVSMKQNSIPLDIEVKSELNELVLKEIDDSSKNNYPLNTHHIFEKQNTFSDLSSRKGQNEKNLFISKNHQFIRKKSICLVKFSFQYS